MMLFDACRKGDLGGGEIARKRDEPSLVDYRGVLSKSESLVFQQKASMGLVPYLPIANNMVGMPNKLVECMALGLPVVFSDFAHYYEVAGVSGAGIEVNPTRPEQIANAIESLIRNPDLARQMSEAGRRPVHERFNWNVERVKFLELYKSILKEAPFGGTERRSCRVRRESSWLDTGPLS
jgi:glycosyltransferase involved in cell wall biosynthesis